MAAEVSMCSSSGSAELTPEEERVLIRDIALAAESNAEEGATFYLITQKWWHQWIEYVNQDLPNNINDGSSLSENCDSAGSTTPTVKRPGAIDNTDLTNESALEDSNGEVVDTLLEGRDYVLLPYEVWNQFYMWYGGGPPLPRKVISAGLSQTELAVEVYSLRLRLILMPKEELTTIRISKKETIGVLYRRACEIFDLDSEQVCIWDYYGHRKHALMNDLDRTLDDANIQMDQDRTILRDLETPSLDSLVTYIVGFMSFIYAEAVGNFGLLQILVEVMDKTGGTALRFHENGSLGKEAASLPLESPKPNLSNAGGIFGSKFLPKISELAQSNLTRESESSHGISGVHTRGSYGGLTGLLNLGNTCFMNSAIQCLVHTPEFAKYFREDYHQEINWQNPLGMVGELALAFGELLRKLWAPGRTPISPRPFKNKLSRFAPQFSGYNQHDSQELLAFLLDGLHEDLNRVKKRPYINSRDADGRPDEEVADEYWANHIARNNSIIVDVCQGQYKSTLVCPVCDKVSVTFDPFMYLSLPLQFTSTRNVTVTVFTCDGSALPARYTVAVSKQGRCRDLIQVLSNACSLKPNEKLLLSEVKYHSIQRTLDDPLVLLSTIKDDDRLAAYKIPKFEKNIVYLRLLHRHQEQAASEWKPWGVPLVTPILGSDGIKRGDVQKIVQQMLSPLLKDKDSQQTKPPDEAVDAGTCEGPSSSNIPLQLVDEDNKYTDLSVGEEKVIKLPSSSSSISLVINWSLELLERYDVKYLENLPEACKYGHVSKKTRTEPLTLYTCMEAFLREEPLVPEDMWYCPQCKEQRQASKKLDLWRLPEVLVIHLKRFSYSRSVKHKLETFVHFPIHDFNLTNYVANKNSSQCHLYELYALINHYGGMGSGHYTAHIKLLDENRWYNFDDNHISSINEDDVKSSAAYVLFYRRKQSVSNGEQSIGLGRGSVLCPK